MVVLRWRWLEGTSLTTRKEGKHFKDLFFECLFIRTPSARSLSLPEAKEAATKPTIALFEWKSRLVSPILPD